ncbi:type II secretion system protein J [Cohnella faecalis]|uniref:Prepilin-type N-terminal cleavage/methylation domain-containing protein n=1 Tax=Cohnella faecalis TaxID=2315694 RepID=A0A398CFY3_9BACL|nr:prepilin-type N-terminal cleavage/methylation domain-containing protein [Cohnella faecalis]RIE01345.1 prepilin-type N-terminal cleavage/methylation domain-containing protein [Cohnella faecalis]
MLKYANNQKGLTLIELLGAIALSAIVTTTAFFIFSGLTNFTQASSKEGRQAQNEAKFALSQLSTRLQDSIGIFAPTDKNELRYSVFVDETKVAYKAVYYENGTLTLYDFVGTTGDWSDDKVSLKSTPPAPRTSYADLYKKKYTLAQNLFAAPTYNTKSAGALTALVGSATKNSLIEISIKYKNTSRAFDGTLQFTGEKTLQTTFKRFNDGL